MKRKIIDSCHEELGFIRFDITDANFAPGMVPTRTTKKKSEMSVAFNPTSLDKYTTDTVVNAPTLDCANMVASKYHRSPFLYSRFTDAAVRKFCRIPYKTKHRFPWGSSREASLDGK
mmetsp:Transcript_1661/g.3657  ORF Transcript_1661/g.3657 Transcript_1661/m.3657 type:complete len:117 (-) Transcript_1661:848-1198(-)